jgi:acyl-CoA thioesterase FadM
MTAPPRDRVQIPLPADLATGVWRETLLIRFSHCDPAGIVYFPRYFDIGNSVVEDWFPASLGLDYHVFIAARRIGLGFVNVACDFLKPGMMGDQVTFAVLVEAIGNASITLKLYGYRDDAPLLAMRLVMVTTSLTLHRAIPIPDDLRAAVETYRERCR